MGSDEDTSKAYGRRTTQAAGSSERYEGDNPHTRADRVLERAVREARGRLLAFLAARSGDIAAAEDALADAVASALETWPISGVPQTPEAWLLTAARRKLLDRSRHAHVATGAATTLALLADDALADASSRSEFIDERLALLFICAHPAIDPAARSPLMLQVVLGLDAVRIASAFLVKPATMGQRLTRAKTKIRDAHIRYAVPQREELPDRLSAVLDAIYAAYGTGWDDIDGADAARVGLTEEAIYLARLLDHLLPDQPEVLGLLALMLFCEARRGARRNGLGAYVPLQDQDADSWSREMLEEAERRLNRAASLGGMGRYQLEAAIQSCHAERRRTGSVDWEAIALLYEGLLRVAPTVGVLVGRASAIAELRGATEGLRYLHALPDELVASYQPYWALAAHLLAKLKRRDEARAAYSRAIGLSTDAAGREYLNAKLAEMVNAANDLDRSR